MVTNLCLIRTEAEILLAMKKRRFGAGRWNGYGGKVQEGETVEAAMIREVKEESGLTVTKYRKVGDLVFHNIDRIVTMDVFEAMEYQGELVETEEMAPQWFPLDKLPFEDMWKSDLLWYPYYLKGEYFSGEVVFDENHKVVSHTVHKVG